MSSPTSQEASLPRSSGVNALSLFLAIPNRCLRHHALIYLLLSCMSLKNFPLFHQGRGVFSHPTPLQNTHTKKTMRKQVSLPTLVLAVAVTLGASMLVMTSRVLSSRSAPCVFPTANGGNAGKAITSLRQSEDDSDESGSSASYADEDDSSLIPKRPRKPIEEEQDTEDYDFDDDSITEAKLEHFFQSEKKRFESYYADAMQSNTLRHDKGPLKIAGFTRLWPPPIHNKGGMQYHAMHLYSRLASLGHTVHVFTTGSPGRVKAHYFSVHPKTLKVEAVTSKESAQLTVYQCPSKRDTAYSVQWYESTLQKYKEVGGKIGGFDVAHSESWAAVANTYQLGVPLAVTWHGSMMDWFRNEMNQIVQNWRLKQKMPNKDHVHRLKTLGESIAAETFALQTVPHHIVISDSARDDLMSADLIPSERVHLVYNGVNEENYKPDKSVRDAFLSKHGVSETTHFIVGCGGRLAPEKGHGQLARAMDEVLSKHDDIILLVAGTGAEGKKYEKLRAKGLAVHMIGMLNQDELAKFYNAIDIFVDPYWQHHGLNTVMIEAALSATPIVATGLAPSKTTIPNPAFGQVFGLGIKSDLVRAVLYYKKHPEFKAKVGSHLRERALKLFTSTVMAGKYEKVLYDAVQYPVKLIPVLGEVTCKDTYPAMCYRMPKEEES